MTISLKYQSHLQCSFNFYNPRKVIYKQSWIKFNQKLLGWFNFVAEVFHGGKGKENWNTFRRFQLIALLPVKNIVVSWIMFTILLEIGPLSHYWWFKNILRRKCKENELFPKWKLYMNVKLFT